MIKRDFSKKDQKFTLKRKIKEKDCLLEIYDTRFSEIENSLNVSSATNFSRESANHKHCQLTLKMNPALSPIYGMEKLITLR